MNKLKTLLSSMLLASVLLGVTTLGSFAATEINLRNYHWKPVSFPITNLLVSWDGPCGVYTVKTNGNLVTDSWVTAATITKEKVLNLPLHAAFTIFPGTSPALFVRVELVEDDPQDGCRVTQMDMFVEPQDQTVCTGDPARFETYTTGPDDRTHQWYFDGVAISGATAMIYNIDEVDSADGGEYYVVASSSTHTITSDVAVLTVVSCLQSQSAPPPPPSFYSMDSREARKELKLMLRTVLNPEINPVINQLMIEVELQEK